MTNPYTPLQGMPGFGAGAALTGMPGFAPQQVQQPGTVRSSVFGAGAPSALATFDAAHPVSDIGAGETVATQAGRGMLDALLGSGAVLGVASQGVGSVSGWKGLEDFGRDLGRSSSGAAAVEAAAFLFGGGGAQGVSYAEKTTQRISEQEAAWPLLSAVSRIGGGVAFAVGTGGLSGAAGGFGATRAGLATLGGIEGAAAGIQDAYYKNESLRDVLVSGAIGGAFGGAGGAAVGKIGEKLREFTAHRSQLQQLFGDVKTAADDVADEIRKAGGKETYDAVKAVLKERADVLRQLAAAGENPSLIRQAYDKASRSAGENLSRLAGDFDTASWATKTPSAMQKLLHRTPLLDRVSSDLAEDAASLAAARPRLDFDLKVPSKLLKDADGIKAISGLQGRITSALEAMPAPTGTIAGSTRLSSMILDASAALQKANPGEAMAIGHKLARQLGEVAAGSDEVTAAFARRQAGALMDELGGEAWGSAGKAYRSMATADSPLAGLDAKALREALKHADSSRALPGAFAETKEALTAAYAARKQLGGDYADDATRSLWASATKRAEKAHEAVTFDGAPARRILDILSGAGRNIGESYTADLLGMGVGAMIGGVPGMILARALSPVLGDVAAAAFGKSVRGAGQRAGRSFAKQVVKETRDTLREGTKGSIAWQQFTFDEKFDQLSRAVEGSTLADLHKPEPNIRGKAWETLSRGDLQKAQAMWEATMEPMSVFSDFSKGNVNYDKVRYAWKQYPGLQQAAQAGLMDIIHTQLDDKGREKISDGMMTQLDNLFGFDGALQPTLDRGFAGRMSQLGASVRDQGNPPPRGGGKLQTPSMQPTFTQRLSGQQG